MSELKENQNINIERAEYDLIRGTYSPEDAMGIVNHLLLKKINFHELRNFSQEIRFGITDKNSLKRIEELSQCKEEFKELVREAKLKGKTLKIKSNITVELI